MKNNQYIYSYKPLSGGAKLLADALNIKRIKHKASKFKGKDKKIVINWGSSELPSEVGLCSVINKPSAVYDASRKSRTFMRLKNANVSIPSYTNDYDEARVWAEDGSTVLCRRKEAGSGGDGIIVAKGSMPPRRDVQEFPLFVLYIPKREEWRVHIAFGKIIDIQKKLSSPDVEVKDWQIRSHDNGFIFRRYGIKPPHQQVLVEAVRAVDALDLHFGAVDVIWNAKRGQAYVLEINTAPGLEGQTVESYRQAFHEFFREN